MMQISDEFVRIWLVEILWPKVKTWNLMKEKVWNFFSLSNPVVYSCNMVNINKTIGQSLDRTKDDIVGFGLMEFVNLIFEISLDREIDSMIRKLCERKMMF